MEQIVIRRPRMIVALTEQQILDMLKDHPNIWAVALKRGKGLLRLDKSMNRNNKKGCVVNGKMFNLL